MRMEYIALETDTKKPPCLDSQLLISLPSSQFLPTKYLLIYRPEQKRTRLSDFTMKRASIVQRNTTLLQKQSPCHVWK